MSMRQALTAGANTSKATRNRFEGLFTTGMAMTSELHLGDLARLEPFEKRAGLGRVEQQVCRLDDEEEAILRRQGEVGRVEHGMVRLRKTVEREHAEHCGERRDQDGGLEH